MNQNFGLIQKCNKKTAVVRSVKHCALMLMFGRL